MEQHPTPVPCSSNPAASFSTVGFQLLPPEVLLHEIFTRLAAPELLRLRSVSKPLSVLLTDSSFRRLYGANGTWAFVYEKRPPRGSLLRAFNDRSDRWLRIPCVSATGLLSPPLVSPGEDLYLLAAAGDFLVFASNARGDLVTVDVKAGVVIRVPPGPTGPRGTGSWRRPGLKLLPGGDSISGSALGNRWFRFLFADVHNGRPWVFEYRSDTGSWLAEEVVDVEEQVTTSTAIEPPLRSDGRHVFLSVGHAGAESLVISVDACISGPGTSGGGSSRLTSYRPRLGRAAQAAEAGEKVMRIQGDGCMAVVRSRGTGVEGEREVTGLEIWGMKRNSIRNGEMEWELEGRAPAEVVKGVRKPYGVMMGCVAVGPVEDNRGGGGEGHSAQTIGGGDVMVRVVLVSNRRGRWDLAWVWYDTGKEEWGWVPVPDAGSSGWWNWNIGGIALSSSSLQPF